MIIRRFVGVYHADGGPVGEMTYLVGKIRGTAGCSLCDITHSRLRTRPQWKTMVADLAVPFDLVHRNERDPELRTATGDDTPCVLARTEAGLVHLLGPDDLAALDGQVPPFAAALRHATAAKGLTWPTGPTHTPGR